MKDIKIIVTKKVASVEGTPIIVCGNSDYTLSFTFDDEWSNEQNKVARFSFIKNGLKSFIDMPIHDNTCQVPVLIGIGLVRVGAYAGDLKTTTGAKIKCHKSILCDDADTMDEPFKNLYENLMGEIAGVKDTVMTDLEPNTIKHFDRVNVWELDAGAYFVDDVVCYATPDPPVNPNAVLMQGEKGFLIVGIDGQTKQRNFYLFANGNIYFGWSCFMLLRADGSITSVVATISNKITSKNPDEIATTGAVYDFVNEKIGGIENGSY